jgi:hypothetical protein
VLGRALVWRRPSLCPEDVNNLGKPAEKRV